MDLSDLRRKRLKLFDQPGSSTSTTSASSKEIIDLTMDDTDEDVPPLQPAQQLSTHDGYTLESTAQGAARNIQPGGCAPAALELDHSPEAIVIRHFTLPLLHGLYTNCGHSKLETVERILERFQRIMIQSSSNKSSKASAKARSKAKVADYVGLTLCCSECPRLSCYACGEPIDNSLRPNDQHVESADGISIRPHCVSETVAQIWLLLCGSDSMTGSVAPVSPKQQLKRMATNTGIGYGYAASDYPGYQDGTAQQPSAFTGQGHTLDGSPGPTKSPKPTASIDPIEDDAAFTTIFNALADLMLLVAQEETCAKSVCCMLLKSNIMEKTSVLLGSGSLDDLIEKKLLYLALFRFLRALASHPRIALHTLHESQISAPTSQRLLKTSTGQPSVLKGEDEKTYRPVSAWLTGFRRSADFFHEWVERNKNMATDQGIREKLEFSDQIIEMAEIVKASAPYQNGVNERPSEHEMHTDGLAWQKDLGFMEVDDEVMFANNVYGSEARDIVNLRPERMKALTRDLEILHTSLPPNIFVRYGESRPDLMKILIVGPGESPYEHGLFEFDLFAGETYPAVPPRMTFRTTGGGVAHFNPNLYQNGYVCLSLLGTWQGPGWNASQSTLLQIFISIQAMIFCKDPWCNEPGRENMSSDPLSKRYNRAIQGLSVRYAMLEWLGVKSKVTRSRPPYHGAVPQGSLPPVGSESKFPDGETECLDENFDWTPFPNQPQLDPSISPTEAVLKFLLPQNFSSFDGKHTEKVPTTQLSQADSSLSPGPYKPTPSGSHTLKTSDTKDSNSELPSGPASVSEALDVLKNALTTYDPTGVQLAKKFLIETYPEIAPTDPYIPSAKTTAHSYVDHSKLGEWMAKVAEIKAEASKQVNAYKKFADPPPPPPMPPAILAKAPPVSSMDFWDPVPDLHFKANSDEILQTVYAWTQTPIPASTRSHRRNIYAGPGKTLGTGEPPSEPTAKAVEGTTDGPSKAGGSDGPAAPHLDKPQPGQDLIKSLQAMLKELNKGGPPGLIVAQYENIHSDDDEDAEQHTQDEEWAEDLDESQQEFFPPDVEEEAGGEAAEQQGEEQFEEAVGSQA